MLQVASAHISTSEILFAIAKFVQFLMNKDAAPQSIDTEQTKFLKAMAELAEKAKVGAVYDNVI